MAPNTPPFEAAYTNSHAVVIGINAYTRVSPLAFAVNDATAVATTLIDKFGFPADHVVRLIDGEATAMAIRSSLHALVAKSAPNDRVLVFFAGHGTTLTAHRREAGFLMPVDGSLADTESLLAWRELVDIGSLIPAKHLLFVMDACYGGLIGTRGVQPGTSRFARDMLSRYTRQFLTAGKADQPVADGGGPRRGHSVFTGHFLDALDGKLDAADGLITANRVMAHVCDRVGRDPQSQQTPHYGLLEGDGDFFFSLPPSTQADAAAPHDDILMAVSPALLSSEDQPPLLEQVKTYLSDPTHRIRLHDLVMREVRATQQRVGTDRMTVQPHEGFDKTALTARLEQYEAATHDLLTVTVQLSHWADMGQQATMEHLVRTLADHIHPQGGSELLLSLRYYPLTLLLYAGGVAALSRNNTASLHTLLATRVRSHRDAKTVTVCELVADAMLTSARCNTFKCLPGHERHYTPQSEYLFKRLQPHVDDSLYLGASYEDLFDRFEVLNALVHADVTNDDWGHFGRFAWKHRSQGRDGPFARLIAEAQQAGAAWPPLRAGLFGGSAERFTAAAKRFGKLLGGLQWR